MVSSLTRPVVGVVGAGQLARMTIEAAIDLDVGLRVLAARADDSAALVWPDARIGVYESLEDLRSFAADCDVITFDHELVATDHLRTLAAEGVCLRPGPAAKLYAQDKAYQRASFARRGLPVPDWRPVAGVADIESFGAFHGWPVVLKAARGGYDGRGVWMVQADESDPTWREAGAGSVGLLVEAAVPIECELAALVVRRPSGDVVAYPPVETVQRDGICTELLMPAPVTDAVAKEAADLAVGVAEAIDAVGVVAVELFWTGERLVINELACRPHNSGHWTIEGAVTSQFANHLRAVCDWPLGSPEPVWPAVATVNVLGPADGSDPARHLPHALAVANASIHLYGKAPRPGRKLGHVTVCGEDAHEVGAAARRVAAVLTGETVP